MKTGMANIATMADRGKDCYKAQQLGGQVARSRGVQVAYVALWGQQ